MIQKLLLAPLFFLCALAAFSQENPQNIITSDSVLLFTIHPKKENHVNPDVKEKHPLFSDSVRRKIALLPFSTDSLPVVTPKHLDGSLIVVRPDSSAHYFIQNVYPKVKKGALQAPSK